MPADRPLPRTRQLLALAGACAAALAAGATPAGAAAGLPAHGRTLLGVVGPDPDAFEQLTHHRQLLHLTFGSVGGAAVASDQADGRIPIVSIEPGAAPLAVSKGAIDRSLLASSAAYNGARWPVWVRPMPEMNGHWSPDCAVTASGASRGPAYAASAFRAAFARMSVILHGGTAASMNARLRSLHQPRLPAGAADVPASGQVRLMWNPQGRGSPDVAGNRPIDYWPGARFVDIVADDLYSIGFKADFADMDALYGRYAGKPFVVAEWAPWGTDDDAFVRSMFSWAAAHPRTAGLVYFDRGWSGGNGIFRLGTKPKALAAYRAGARSSRYPTKLP
jgi:hypothetical protein